MTPLQKLYLMTFIYFFKVNKIDVNISETVQKWEMTLNTRYFYNIFVF